MILFIYIICVMSCHDRNGRSCTATRVHELSVVQVIVLSHVVRFVNVLLYAETLGSKRGAFLCPWRVVGNSPVVPSNWIADEIREVIFITASFARAVNEKEGLPMSLEENKSNTHRWFEKLNQGNSAVKRR